MVDRWYIQNTEMVEQGRKVKESKGNWRATAKVDMWSVWVFFLYLLGRWLRAVVSR